MLRIHAGHFIVANATLKNSNYNMLIAIGNKAGHLRGTLNNKVPRDLTIISPNYRKRGRRALYF